MESRQSQQSRWLMNHTFKGWAAVAEYLQKYAKIQPEARLNDGQRASLCAIAERLPKNGVVIADEVGMGKTRIAVEVARAVVEAGGRVAILVPPGLGYQWQRELRDGRIEAPQILRSLDGQAACRHLGHAAGDFPEAERASREALALPIEIGRAHV